MPGYTVLQPFSVAWGVASGQFWESRTEEARRYGQPFEKEGRSESGAYYLGEEVDVVSNIQGYADLPLLLRPRYFNGLRSSE